MGWETLPTGLGGVALLRILNMVPDTSREIISIA